MFIEKYFYLKHMKQWKVSNIYFAFPNIFFPKIVFMDFPNKSKAINSMIYATFMVT